MGILEEHYEKIALGVGGLTLVGAVYLGLGKVTSTEEIIINNNGGARGRSVVDLLKKPVTGALNSIKKESQLNPVMDKNVDRQLYMYKSIPRHAKRGESDIIDLFEPSSPQVHKGVENSWWFDNGIQEHMGFENALKMDFDKDGFTNGEEHDAKTSPNDFANTPPLLRKVKVHDISIRVIEIKFTEASGDSIFFNVRARNPSVRVNELLKVGDKGPKGNQFNNVGELKNRFLYKEKIKGVGFGNDDIILLDTQLGDKKFTVNRKDSPYELEDLTISLFLDALGKGNEPLVKLKEGDTFSLPFGGQPEDHKVKSITKKEGNTYIVELVGPNGETKTIEVKS